jgi:hypothetical protein
MRVKDIFDFEEVKSSKFFLRSSGIFLILIPLVTYYFYYRLIKIMPLFFGMNLFLIYLIYFLASLVVGNLFLVFYPNTFKYFYKRHKKD